MSKGNARIVQAELVPWDLELSGVIVQAVVKLGEICSPLQPAPLGHEQDSNAERVEKL